MVIGKRSVDANENGCEPASRHTLRKDLLIALSKPIGEADQDKTCDNAQNYASKRADPAVIDCILKEKNNTNCERKGADTVNELRP
jgi:hypothetical protein